MTALDEQIGGSHYKDNFAIQPSLFITKNKLLFNEGCVIKYVCRHPYKGGRLDLEKAKQYIDIIIEDYYPKEESTKPPVCICALCEPRGSIYTITNFYCNCHKETKDAG